MSPEQRKKHNDRVLSLWRSGHTLATVSPQSTWFPPRPVNKKFKKISKQETKIFNFRSK